MHVPVSSSYLPNLTQLTFEAELEKAWEGEGEREREGGGDKREGGRIIKISYKDYSL